MKAMFGEYPDSFRIVKKDDDGYIIRLRKNIQEIEIQNDDEGISTSYKCDEIEIRIPIMPERNVESYIENNFNRLWTFNDIDEIYQLKKENADLWFEMMKVIE